MGSMRKLTTAMLALLVCTGVLVTAKVKIQSQGDPKFDFKTLKTWEWSATPGDVKVWVSSQSDPAPVKKRFEPVILQAVADQLQKRGFTQAGADAPDFLVTYWVLITAQMTSQEMGQFLPSVAYWGIPPFAPQTTAFSVYPEGALVLDVTSRTTGNVVWRGLAQARINLDNSDKKRDENLRDAIEDLLKEFPPKK